VGADGAGGLTRRIAVIPGDGVGPEVVAEAMRVLARVAQLEPKLSLVFESFDWGTDHYLRSGAMMPPDGLQRLASFDAILFGAVGDPRVPDNVSLRSMLLTLRFAFDLFVNLRPIRLLQGVRTPLRGRTSADIHMTFIREGTEGEYAGLGGRFYQGTDRELALQTSVFTRAGAERVIRWAFDRARLEGRSLTSISKGNALQYTAVLWDQVFDEMALEYQDVKTRRLLVDAAAMLMVRSPERFEVVVASNLFADILTDLGAAIMGGIGLAPSANLDPSGAHPPIFEPVHGSAPDIAGRGVANPIGAIWSGALMLEHLGFPSWSDQIVEAIEGAVGDGIWTADLGGSARTEELGAAITERLTHPTTPSATLS